MTTEYAISLDRDACEGVFACLVRDDRFVEAADGLARIDDADAVADGDVVATDGGDAATAGHDGTTPTDEGDATAPTDDVVVAAFDDDRLADARQAARACPVNAIEVRENATDADVATEGDDE